MLDRIHQRERTERPIEQRIADERDILLQNDIQSCDQWRLRRHHVEEARWECAADVILYVISREYYLERLRSYGDVRYHNIATYLEKLKKQFARFDDPEKTKEYINYRRENFVMEDEMKLLDQEVSFRKGTNYLIFFS